MITNYGSYLPTIFSDSKSNYPGFPQFSVFEKNIGFTQTLEKALNIADRFKNDNNSRTEAKVTAKAKLKENGVYEISVTVSTNLSARDTTGVVAYARENEIMTDGKIDQAKVDKIANNSINTVMEWKNEKKTLIKVFLAFIFVVFISCKNNKSTKYENEKNILVKLDGSPVELELRLGENKELTSFLLKDESQEFSLMLNLLTDGNYSLKIQTNLIDNTVNTEVCDTNNRYISQFIDIKNKLFLHQEINNDGSVNSQSKITAHQ